MQTADEIALNDLHEYNSQGIFPIPNECEQGFVQRAKTLLEDAPKENRKADFVQSLLKEVYDIAPSWVPIIFDDKGLHFWEAGCTWYENDINTGYIQLKKKLEEKKTLFAIYDRDEILAHELVHAVRLPLQSKRFEEIFAYLVSWYIAKKKNQGICSKFFILFRTTFGPLFFTPFETSSFLLLTLITTFCTLFIPFFSFGTDLDYLLSFTCCIPLVALSFFLVRLCTTWMRFWQCKNNICSFYQKSIDMHNALAIMVRLSDEDIMKIATFKKNIEQNKENDCSFYVSFIQKIYGTRKGKFQC